MMRYLLLFISTLLLLFTLPQPGRSVNSLTGVEKPKLTKTCNIKRNLKHTCAKKCLKHQTQQEQQRGSGTTTDCSPQLFAVLNTQQAETYLHFSAAPATIASPARTHLSPDLETEPDPPRFS